MNLEANDPLVASHAGFRFVLQKAEILNYFLKIQEAISTTAPVWGMFVPVLMHLSCLIKIWPWKFEFLNLFEKSFWWVVCTQHPRGKGFHHQLQKSAPSGKTINLVRSHPDSYNELHFQQSASMIAKKSCVHGA